MPRKEPLDVSPYRMNCPSSRPIRLEGQHFILIPEGYLKVFLDLHHQVYGQDPLLSSEQLDDILSAPSPSRPLEE
jgi:hypothetical protein